MTFETFPSLPLMGYPRLNVDFLVVLPTIYSPEESRPVASAFLKYLRSATDMLLFDGTEEAQMVPEGSAMNISTYCGLSWWICARSVWTFRVSRVCTSGSLESAMNSC